MPTTVLDGGDTMVMCIKKGGSMKSHLTGWSDHKFLTGRVMVGSHTPGISFFILVKVLSLP